MSKKIKVIQIKPHLPPYGAEKNDIHPEVTFNIVDGGFVGMWDYPRERRLCRALSKLNSLFECELWQPDLRADKIYSHTFKDGWVHRIFPADIIGKAVGDRLDVYSQQILDELEQYKNKFPFLIVQLYGYLFGVNKNIVLEKASFFAIVFSFRGEIYMPKGHLWDDTASINKVRCITTANSKDLNLLKKIYKGKIGTLTMGCDFKTFIKIDKRKCRKELGLPKSKFILISVTWLVYSLKQIDKMVEVLCRLQHKYDFLYVVVGGPGSDTKYANYVQRIAQPLQKTNKILFTGAILEPESIVKYLNSADLYVSVSLSEGGPISVMEAMACELPIFSTTTGNTGGLLQQQQCGCLVGPKDYTQWFCELEKFFQGRKVKIIPRSIARKYYDWPKVARRFANLYRDIFCGFTKK